MGGGDHHVPRWPDADQDKEPPEGKEGVTGYGKLEGPVYSMYGDDVEVITDFPKDLSKLEEYNWHNYSLRATNRQRYPFITRTVDDNRRIWQEQEVDQLLDHSPTFEIHPNDLPDYHYWPSIQNEIQPPRKGLTASVIYNGSKSNHHQDQTYIPRFFRTGVPKTPLQEQEFFLPLNSDGRFNWRLNIDKNGYSASLYSKEGWNNRYKVNIRKARLWGHHLSWLHLTNLPNWFRVNELHWTTRFSRMIKGTSLDKFFSIFLFYSGFLVWCTLSDTNYRRLAWELEPHNYDMAYMSNIRNIGGFHGLV